MRTSLDERMLGITPEQLQRHGRVVALAGGKRKVQPIRAALKGHIISVLIPTRRRRAHSSARHLPND